MNIPAKTDDELRKILEDYATKVDPFSAVSEVDDWYASVMSGIASKSSRKDYLEKELWEVKLDGFGLKVSLDLGWAKCAANKSIDPKISYEGLGFLEYTPVENPLETEEQIDSWYNHAVEGWSKSIATVIRSGGEFSLEDSKKYITTFAALTSMRELLMGRPLTDELDNACMNSILFSYLEPKS